MGGQYGQTTCLGRGGVIFYYVMKQLFMLVIKGSGLHNVNFNYI